LKLKLIVLNKTIICVVINDDCKITIVYNIFLLENLDIIKPLKFLVRITHNVMMMVKTDSLKYKCILDRKVRHNSAIDNLSVDDSYCNAVFLS